MCCDPRTSAEKVGLRRATPGGPFGPCPFAIERLYAAVEQNFGENSSLCPATQIESSDIFCYFCASLIGAIPRPVALVAQCSERRHMSHFLRKAWLDEEGQDIAEYSVMLAVILVIAVGTVRLIGSNASNVFSQLGSAIQ